MGDQTGRRALLVVLAVALALAVGCGGDDGNDDATADESSTTTESTTTTSPPTSSTVPLKQWYSLNPGDCVADMPASGSFTTVETTDCEADHEGEVVFAGQAGNQTDDEKCTASFAEYAGTPLDGSGFSVTWFSLDPDQPPATGDIPGVPALPPAGAAGADLMVICVAIPVEGGSTTGTLAA